MKKAATFCNGISRRKFLHSATLGTAAVASSSAFGLEASGGVDDTTELVVGCWGGATTDIIKRGVIHDLEQRYKARILIKEGTSGDRIAQLRANPNNPPLDVSHFSDFESLPLIEEGILDKPSDQVIPEFDDLYPVARISGFGQGLSEVGIVYNPKKISARVTSWLDLWNPAYKGHVVLPSLKTTQGISFLPVLAKVLSGDQKNIEAAKNKLLELKPNVLAYHNGSSQALTMLEQGDAWITLAIGGYVYQAKDQGQSIEFVRPKEGSFSNIWFMAIARNTKHRTLAREYVRLSLQEKAQRAMAEGLYLGPSNRKVTLSGKAATFSVYGEDQVSKLINPDWSLISNERASWIEWWNREMTI